MGPRPQRVSEAVHRARWPRFLGILASGFASASVADAQDRGDSLDIGDVVVTGTRVDTPASQTVTPVDVIGPAVIRASSARDVGELLEEQPGVVVTRSFRGDAIQLGGLDPEYTLILVDGVRVPGRIGGGIDLGRYGIENVERVEIVRGPASALYGSDAIAGVVNIITRAPTEDFEAEASARGGYGAGAVVDGQGRVSGSIDRTRFRLSGGYHFADSVDFDPSTPATDLSGREQGSLEGRVVHEFDDHHRVELQLDGFRRSIRGVDAGAGGAVFDRVQQADQLSGRLMHVFRQGTTELRTRVSHSFFRELFLNDQRNATALDDRQDNSENMTELSLQVSTSLGDHRLVFGFDQLHQTLASERLQGPGRRSRLSPFAEDQWIVVDETDVSFTLSVGARVDVDSQFGSAFSPRIAGRLDLGRNVVLRASYGFGFRAPSFQELLLRFENPGVGYVVTGNPDLTAERSRGAEAGVEWNPDSHLRLGLSAFRNDVDDMISTISTTAPDGQTTLFTYENISTAMTQGFDARVSYRPIDELSFDGGYSFLDTFDGERQRPIEGRPAHRATLQIQARHPETHLAISWRSALTGERTYYDDSDGDGVDDTTRTVSPFFTADVRATYSPIPELDLAIGVDNLFDASDSVLLPRPRTFHAEVRGRL